MMQSYRCAFSQIDIVGYQSHPHHRNELGKTVRQGFDETGYESEPRNFGFVQDSNLLVELFSDRHRNLDFRDDHAQTDERLKGGFAAFSLNKRDDVTWHGSI